MENNALVNLFDGYLADINDEFKEYDLPCRFSARYKKRKKQIIKMFKDEKQNGFTYEPEISKISKRHRFKISLAVILAALLLCGAGIASQYVFRAEYGSVSEASEDLGVSLIEYNDLKWQEAYLSESGNVKILQAGVVSANELPDNGAIVKPDEVNTIENVEVQSITAILFETAATENERKEAFEMLLSPKVPVKETFYCDSLSADLKFYCGQYENEIATAYTAVAVLEQEDRTFLISLKNIDDISEDDLSKKIKEVCEEMRWTKNTK